MNRILLSILTCVFVLATIVPHTSGAGGEPMKQFAITSQGAIADGQTLNTEAIQKTIDAAAAAGGGTVVIPQGIFLSGAIFLKPGVNLQLDEGAVLKGSSDTKDYPKMKTRIEGHFEEWLPALVNADKCDHLRIAGSGTLDGNGQFFWTAFWDARKKDPKVTNLAVERPRLALIQNSEDVQISGIIFKDSGFWNLHLYRCNNVVVENARFQVPKDAKCPSTDGTDIDSCQNVTIRGCTYSVNDDCIALKGSKGPFAMQDKDSPPVEHIRVENCTFAAGYGVVTCGSEATIVRDVIVEDCQVTGKVPLVSLKLRPDTAQDYEDIHFQNITLSGSGKIFQVGSWTQFFDLKGQPKPQSIVRNVTLTDIKGSFGAFGLIEGNPGQTEISDITIQNVDVQLKDGKLKAGDVKNLKMENVTVNGKPLTAAE
jgi:polygalacturonase